MTPETVPEFANVTLTNAGFVIEFDFLVNVSDSSGCFRLLSEFQPF